jgi:hypothetical protein
MTAQGPEGLYRAGRYEKSSLTMGAEEEGGDGEGTHAYYDINLATRRTATKYNDKGAIHY